MRALNFCNVRAIKQQICPGAIVSSQNFYTHDGLVHTNVINGVDYFDARNLHGLGPRRIYAIISANNGCGIYIPVGRVSLGKQMLNQVPICVGGGRDMCFTATGLTPETHEQTIRREAREEIGVDLDILNMQTLNVEQVDTHKVVYYLVRLRKELSHFQYSWDIHNSDQVVAMRYWAIPDTWETVHGSGHRHADGEMARLLFDDLSCDVVHRSAWITEWHAYAYDKAIGEMLKASVRHPWSDSGLTTLSRWYANLRHNYHSNYADYPVALQAEHEIGCNTHCAWQFDQDVLL